MERLTDKEEGYVQGLLKGLSQREAYKQSYNASRMKDESIDVRACELFKKSKVKLRYDELHDKVIEKAESEGLMTATELLKILNELIVRNLNTDDKIALEGIKTLGKNLNTFTDKVELAVTELPEIVIKRGER